MEADGVPLWQDVQLVRLDVVGQRLGYACAMLIALSKSKAIDALIIIRFVTANDIEHTSLLGYGFKKLTGYVFRLNANEIGYSVGKQVDQHGASIFHVTRRTRFDNDSIRLGDLAG